MGPGHTAIVLSDGSLTGAITEKKAADNAKHFSKSIAGSYTVSASRLNVRHGAGTLKNILVAIPKNTEVKCFGYYTKVLAADWLYIQFVYQGIKYTGFASAKYLVKK